MLLHDSQKLKKAKQRVALQKNPTSKKPSPGAAIVGNTPIKPPPAKKQKLQAKPKTILSSNGVIGTSNASLSGTQLGAAKLMVPPVDNTSSSQHTTQAVGVAADTVPTEMELGEPQAALPLKEPPVLPDQLPPAALEKVTNLEQVFRLKLAVQFLQHLSLQRNFFPNLYTNYVFTITSVADIERYG